MEIALSVQTLSRLGPVVGEGGQQVTLQKFLLELATQKRELNTQGLIFQVLSCCEEHAAQQLLTLLDVDFCCAAMLPPASFQRPVKTPVAAKVKGGPASS